MSNPADSLLDRAGLDKPNVIKIMSCLLYTSDAADE